MNILRKVLTKVRNHTILTGMISYLEVDNEKEYI